MAGKLRKSFTSNDNLQKEITERHLTEAKLLLQSRIAEIFLKASDDEMYLEVMLVILEAMQSPYGVFGYIDKEGALVVPSMTRHIWDKCQVAAKTIIFPRSTWGHSAWPQAIREQRIICSNEVSVRIPSGHVGIRRHITLPILFQGEAIGLLQVANKATDYTEADIRSLGDIAGHIAPILSARLQRQWAEEQLRQSEAKYRTLVDNIPQKIFMKDRAFRYLSINDNFARDLGIHPQDVVGKIDHDFFSKEFADKYRADDARIFETGLTEEIEEKYLWEGKETWIHTVKTPVRDESGEIVGLLGVFWDITQSKQAGQAMRESERKLRLAEELGHLGHWDYDLRTQRLTWSHEMYCIYDIAPEDFVPTLEGVRHLVHPEDLSSYDQSLETIRHAGQDDFGYRIVRPDGDMRYISGHGQVVLDELGEAVAMFGTVLDITELKRKETELQETNAELERFTYTVSHDLKSPLVTIKTFLGYLEKDLKGADAERIQQDMGYMHNAADKMGELLSELLEMSRIGRLTNPPVLVTFQELVKEAVDLVTGIISARKVDVQIDDVIIPLHGDRMRLVEIWQNLVENAVKFMGEQERPCIEIGVIGQGREAVFFVRDNGEGIDPRYQSKVFGLFERLDVHSEGTGIGLALVKRIVELYGGTIWVESEGSGSGATFLFTLPKAVMD